MAAVVAGLAACSVSAPDPEPPARVAATGGPESGTPSTTAPTEPAPTATPPRPAWGPTRADIRRARQAVHNMTLAERAGQVIVAGYSGTAAPTALVDDYHLGGVIVMGDNVASVEAVRRSNRRLQRTHEQPWPLFIGVDQEGGVVNRLGAPMTRFPTFMSYGAARRPDLTRAAARASGRELRAAGFTAVFAPDADVTLGPADPTIGSRSAGSRPGLVARTVTDAVDGYAASGILPVVKHFPGHGGLTSDSHVGLPVQPASPGALGRRDLRPFRAAVDAGVPAVMVGHIDVRAIDPGIPATVSRRVVSGLLRSRVGFSGLVVTDAMEMGAVVQRFRPGVAAVRALRAGADVVLMPPDVEAAHAAI
ncbi:MAG: beta-N-acetylhexosaminidase, partial [Actinomycetota bacterium]|nr:beta-N-acetylhexosaminidase [Actinomycetota bacterium]